jgi:hypothetical protein
MDKDDTTPESYITEQMVELRRKHYNSIDASILDSYINLQIRKSRRWVAIIAVSLMIPVSVFVYQYTKPSGPPITDCAIVAAVTEFPTQKEVKEVKWRDLRGLWGEAPSDMQVGYADDRLCVTWKGVTTCFNKDVPSI